MRSKNKNTTRNKNTVLDNLKSKLLNVKLNSNKKSRSSRTNMSTKSKIKSIKSKAKPIKSKAKPIGGSKLKIDFISSNILNKRNGKSRINYILDTVRDGTILVTDGVMTPDEELELIRETMRRVDDGFPGVEVASLRRNVDGYQKLFEQVSEQKFRIEKILSALRGTEPPKLDLKYGMTLIGPSKLIKEIKKNPDSFSVFAEMKK